MDIDGLRRRQWSDEEDTKLSHYVALHGVGNWNSLARLAGLKRTSKSCRLRWLNYLRPDLRHGSFSLEEKLRILQLHLAWGNKWSKIAQQLPGRTDNEIKNYWRTKVQKLAKQLKYDINSNQFRDALRHIWIPRLVEQIQGQSSQLGPSHDPLVVNQFGYGPYGEPNCPNSGCFFDPSSTWAQTSSQNWHVNGLGPSDWHSDQPMDSSEAHISPTNSGPSATTTPNLAHSRTREEEDKSYEYDQLLEILLSYEDNTLLYSPLPLKPPFFSYFKILTKQLPNA